jgi:hypothetical protein
MMALSNWNAPRHLDNQLICGSSEKKQVRLFTSLRHAPRRRPSDKPLFLVQREILI